MIKRFLPRSLLGRSLLIIVTPLVLLQVVSALIFFESHWAKVSLRLARGLAGDIASLIDVMDENPGPENRKWIFDLAARNMSIDATMKEGATVAATPPVGNDRMERILIRVVTEIVARPFQIDTESLDRRVIVDVQLAGGVLQIVTTRKRLFSSTTYVFILWMVGTSMILFGVATVFMRNQV
ncbi:MAG: two-component sensor histidine kinase, partial [Proteobacteria bacterium]|nr:two-component sensor histidine kinase [Pseudomonadota bacterium]